MWDGLRLAIGTFSVVPVGELPALQRIHARWSLLLAPIASLPVAVPLAAVAWLAGHLGAPELLTGILAVGFGAYLTRGMHVDGLADTVDALGAGWDRQRAMQVMKSGDVGPMGVVALVVTLIVQAACVGQLADNPVLVAAIWCLGRTGCVWVSALLAPMRAGGLGAIMARAVTPLAAAAVFLVWLSVWVAACVGLNQPNTVCWAGPVVGMCVNLWLIRRADRVFGGSSGDIFGASVELTTSALLVGAVCGGAV